MNWFSKKIGVLTETGLDKMVYFVQMLVLAVIIIIVGRKLISLLLKILQKNFKRLNTDEGVAKFLLSFLKILLNVLLFVFAAQLFGLTSSTVVAMVGSAGLAIGLALQGSLANFAGGVLILVMKPFTMGDYIISGDKEGTVVGIDIIYTKLLTPDNCKVILPNGALANSNIVNMTKEAKRRVDISVSIEHSEDISRVKAIIEELLNQQTQIIPEEPRDIFVSAFNPSSITMGIRVWALTDDYWELKWSLMEGVKLAFDANQIKVPFDKLDVNIIK